MIADWKTYASACDNGGVLTIKSLCQSEAKVSLIFEWCVTTMSV